MPTFHDVLVAYLRMGQPDTSWLPKIEESPDGQAGGLWGAPWLLEIGDSREDTLKIKFGTDRYSKKLLRLTADSATSALLANPRCREYAAALARVRRVTDVRSAGFAAARLRKIAAIAKLAGETQAAPYRKAALLAENVAACYRGEEFPDTYSSVANVYHAAVDGGLDEPVRPVILKLLVDVQAVEKRAASALG